MKIRTIVTVEVYDGNGLDAQVSTSITDQAIVNKGDNPLFIASESDKAIEVVQNRLVEMLINRFGEVA